ncbi:receptor-like protein kinase [Seminavis robusta]|uniref:Receptor-like protein kinase n=1 Tax=Seminavis robusta TaxID=568900 RepID=A0A9N8HAS5_9STRA|nr:receptor-like protein kinase [Seminavis robusta]|eukprot:Sro308_g113470.1 receptor-like protein kinase (586) ;mRNA; r:5128-6970
MWRPLKDLEANLSEPNCEDSPPAIGAIYLLPLYIVPRMYGWAKMEPSAVQVDDEEEIIDSSVVAAGSRGDNAGAELRELESEAKQGEYEQSKKVEMGRSFQSSQYHPNTTGDNSMGEETIKEEKDAIVSKIPAVHEQIKSLHQVNSKTASADAGLDDRPSATGDNSTGEETKEQEEAGLRVDGPSSFPQPRLTRGQNLSDEAAMHPGAYTSVPGTDLQRTTTLSRSLVGATSSAHVEDLTSNINARNQSTADDQATTPTDNNSGLAVATQVEEHVEPTQIARPDNLHGKNGSTSMTPMILVLIGGILIIGIVVGSICGAGLCSNQEGDVKTQAPTSIRYSVLEDIQNRIEEAFGPDYFMKTDEPEPTQPKFKALDWIVFEDPLQLSTDANNLLQRFILSLTYFQTSQESDWINCGPSTTAKKDDTCWIPMDVSNLASGWLTGVHECQWAGIFCDGEKSITQLLLWHNGLNGPLPTELVILPALESLSFRGNQLTGSIPLELFENNKLSFVSFFNNSLTGTVPTQVGLFSGTSLRFDSNSLSGSIPTELFQVGKRIASFGFNDNGMTTLLGNRTQVTFQLLVKTLM